MCHALFALVESDNIVKLGNLLVEVAYVLRLAVDALIQRAQLQHGKLLRQKIEEVRWVNICAVTHRLDGIADEDVVLPAGGVANGRLMRSSDR